jgi:hypothetical protein
VSTAESQFVTSKPRRRWYQFSLRSLFLLIFAAAVVLAKMEYVSWVSSEKCCRKELDLFCQGLIGSGYVANGHLPCAYVMDSNGRRMHSWRSCIIWSVDIYESGGDRYWYSLDEPWDSPADTWFRNASAFYKYYACPVHAAGSRNASYLCVVGGALWPLPETKDERWNRTSLRSMKEGGVFPSHRKAILLVEVVESDIPWTKPEDISLSEIAALVREDPSGDRFRRRIRHVVAVDATGNPFILDSARDIEEIRELVESEAAGQTGQR